MSAMKTAQPALIQLFADVPSLRHGRRVQIVVEGASGPAEARRIVREWFADLRRAGEAEFADSTDGDECPASRKNSRSPVRPIPMETAPGGG